MLLWEVFQERHEAQMHRRLELVGGAVGLPQRRDAGPMSVLFQLQVGLRQHDKHSKGSSQVRREVNEGRKCLILRSHPLSLPMDLSRSSRPWRVRSRPVKV
jgi:hypothetical protein